MSSEGENTKDLSTEVDKTSVDNVDDNSSEDSQNKDSKTENDEEKSSEKNEPDPKVLSDKPLETVEKKESDGKKENQPENCEEPKTKDEKQKNENNENKTDNDTEEGEDSNKDDDNEKKVDKKGVPLLDQPLEQSGTRERKKVQRFNEDFSTTDAKEVKAEVPSGTGIQLGEIPRIDASISRFKNDDLKLLHRLLYKTPGKTTLIKKNIKKFNGFDFNKDSEEYSRKMDSVRKFELKQLKSICEMLDLEKKGTKEEIVQRVVDFLIEPKDSGKPVGGGRPKRTAAVRANNRGYSSHDDSYSSDERRASRGGRGKGKRTNLKDDSTSESDEEFHPSDASESRPRVVKRKKGGRKKTESDEDDDDDEDDASEVESPTSEDSDDEPRKRKKSKKITNNKTKGKSTPRTRGRKPATESEKKTATPKKGGRKRDRDSSEDSEQHGDNNASSSEDEPLIKKAKSPQPPTDEEIKKYVKEILDGANLEEITMKTVCKQVYAHYPDFDLAHKKDFIKSTVKSLIST